MATAIELKNHPAADAWPMMDDERYGELLADIQDNGQREPITLCDGMILDGRNRYRACVELGLEPLTREHDGNPWDLAWSLNGERRDMDKVVRALVRKRRRDGSAEWEKAKAKIKADGRMKMSAAKAGNANASKAKTTADTKCPQLNSGGEHVARKALAVEAGVSLGTASKAEQIAKRPDLERKVKAINQ